MGTTRFTIGDRSWRIAPAEIAGVTAAVEDAMAQRAVVKLDLIGEGGAPVTVVVNGALVPFVEIVHDSKAKPTEISNGTDSNDTDSKDTGK